MEAKKNFFGLLFVLVSFSSVSIIAQDTDSLKLGILEYIKDITSDNWEEIVVNKYDWDDTREHREFRDAFANYKIEVQYIVSNGDEVIIWNKITANHMKEYPYGELKGFPASGKEVSWNEVWYWKRSSTKFCEEFDMMVDGVGRMYALGIKNLPY